MSAPPAGHRWRVTLTGMVRHIVRDGEFRALCGADTTSGDTAAPQRFPKVCTRCARRAELRALDVLAHAIARGRTPANPPAVRAHAEVLDEVAKERDRQDVKWGVQNHPDGTGRPGDADAADAAKARCQADAAAGTSTFRGILDEEIAEAYAETDPQLLRAELVQAAAVIVQWVQAIDRRTAAAALADPRHICEVCSQDSAEHPDQCYEPGHIGDVHLPPLCCPGCPCGSFEDAHPPARAGV